MRMSESGYRLQIREAHLHEVRFPRLPADGPDDDAALVEDVELGTLRWFRQTASVTVPLSPSTARAARRHRLVAWVAEPVECVFIALGAVLSVWSFWNHHISGAFFLIVAYLVRFAERRLRAMVRVEPTASGNLRILGVSGLFAAATVDLNPVGTVTVGGPVD